MLTDEMQKIRFDDLYISYAEDQTDAPRIFHEYLSLLCVSSVVGKNVWMPFGYKRMYPNLYFLIVAPSSIHRKSWSQNMAVNLVQEIYPDYVISDCSSREAFIAEFSDEARTPQGCGLIKIDEFKGFMDRMRKSHFEGFIQDLSTMYDGDTIKRRRGVEKVEYYKVESPFLNITAACSFDWLRDSVQAGDVMGGFMARFVWVVHDKKIINPLPNPGIPDPEKRIVLIEKLHRIKDFLGEADFSKEATAYFEDWYREYYTEHQGGMWDANYHRMVPIVRKLSLLNCLIRYEAENKLPAPGEKFIVGVEDLKTSIEMGTKTLDGFADIDIGHNPQDLQTKKVLRFILRHGQAPHSDIMRGVRGANAENLQKAIQTLIQAEVIEVTSTPTGGRAYLAKERAASYLLV